MRWNAANIATEIANGTLRLQRRFAWLPVYIHAKYVWLEFFEILQMYEVKTYHALIDNQLTAFQSGKWINLSKRLPE